MSFTHLHVHTEHSPFDGIIRVSEMFEVVKSRGQNAVAITDHGTLAAMWSAQIAADKAGVKLIPGIETYLANGSRNDKKPFIVPREDKSASESAAEEVGSENVSLETRETPYQHLTLLADSEAGWRNLVLMNNHAQDAIWSKPRIDYDLLASHSEGIIVLTGCMGGPVLGPLSQAITFQDLANKAAWEQAPVPYEPQLNVIRAIELDERADAEEDEEAAQELRSQASAARAQAALSEVYEDLAIQREHDAWDNLESLIAAVGRENVYVEVMDHGIDSESRALENLVLLAREFGLPLVASNDCHYTHAHQHDRGDHLAWLNVPQTKKGSTVDNPSYVFPGHGGYHLRTETEMRAVRPEAWWQEAVSNTQLVADRVPKRILPGHRDLLPKFNTPEGFANNREYMYYLMRQGAADIYGGISKAVHDRIITEMEVIEESGYIDYFLVVHELVDWCLKQGILTGPGRGSAAGSLATYLLGITRVDPLRYSLLFERFLERGRVEPPDIDIDFPQQRRGDVIAHLRERWGADKVAYIGTFQMALAKQALKDAARVLGLPASLGAKLSSLVPDDPKMTLAKIFDEMPPAGEEYRKLVEKDPDAKRVHDIAASFDGITRGVSVHASGIIVSAVPLLDAVPMRKHKGEWVLQWTGPEAEAVGLLKVDVLGLRNLDVIEQATEYIEQTTGEKIDPRNLPDPDAPEPGEAERVANAYRVIGAGRTAGLFQLESPKMTELAMDVSPTSLDDLSALVALFRPGPMGEGLHTEYAARKKNPALISYRDYTPIPAEQEQLATVLDETLGIVVMQEQLMRLGTVVSGFNAGERSQLRKAVSKKKADVMAIVKEKFMAGAPLEHRDENGKVISIPFQEQTAEALWNSMVSFASYAFNKCITGDTVVENASGQKMTVAQLYRRLYGGDSPLGVCPFCNERPARPNVSMCQPCASWQYKFNDETRGLSLLAYDESDGRVRPQRVADVHQNGVREVSLIKLADGRSIRATGNHRFRTPDGYVTVDDLAVGDSLLVDGGYEPQRYVPSEIRTTSGPRLSLPGNKPWLAGEKNSGYVDGGFVKLRTWTEQTRDIAACRECGRTLADGRLERAHLDGNRLNNEPNNLAWMCPSHHKAHDYSRNGRKRRWDKGHVALASEIVSITPAGEEMTYDVEMAEGTDHNFIANGIVSHNSHSAAYGYLAYTTAYLKANWPAEYAAATLAATDKRDKRLQVLRALDAEGVTVLPPDVNLSGAKTRPEPGMDRTIRIGLSEVHGVGSAGDLIVAERERGGAFTSATDVLESVKDSSGARVLSTSIMRSLIESGACDSFGPRLGQVLTVGVADPELGRPVPDVEWGTLERAARQRRGLQVPIGEHPLTALAPVIEKHAPKPLREGFQGRTFRYADQIPDADGERGTFIGVLAAWSEKSYSRGRMANIVLEGATGSISGTMWDTELSALHEEDKVPSVGSVVSVYGRVRYRMIDANPDDPDSEAHSVKELTISQVSELPIPDEPSGGWAPAPFPRVDFVPEAAAVESDADAF